MKWKKTKIKDFTSVITGGTPSTSENLYWNNGNIPWLNSGELNQQGNTGHARNRQEGV